MSPTDRTPRKNWCYAMPLRGGRWGACQVLKLDEERSDVIAFDLVAEEPPTLKQLAKGKPLLLTHHSHTGREERHWVSGLVPFEFVAIGERAPLLRTAMKQQSYAAWANLELQVRLQHRWDHQVPKAEIKRFRKAEAEITIGETTLAPLRPWLSRHEISIGDQPGAKFPLPKDQPVPWQALDAAGRMSRLHYSGHDAGVLKYVASRKLITELTWREHGQTHIDCRGASLIELRLDAARSLQLSVDEDLEVLALFGHGKGRSVTVEHPRAGVGLQLELWQPVGLVMPPGVKGLERLTELEVTHLKELDVRSLARSYPGLQRLTVRGKYARVVHSEALAKLKELRSLTWYDVYELDVPALAKLPKLRDALFHGLRKSDAQLLRKQLAHLDQLEISGAKNDAWIAANADNPLRDWVDDDEAFGEQACKIYAKAYRAATKTGAAAAAKQVLSDFVKALNKLDAKYSHIDTIRREQAYEAYHQLGKLMSVDVNQADAWWGTLSDF